MSNGNEELILFLKDAHQACQSKLEALEGQNEAVDQAELERTKSEVKALFEGFSQQSLWVHPVEYEKSKLLQSIVEIKMAPEQEPLNFLEKVAQLVGYLRDSVLPSAKAFLERADTAEWNLKMLDELLRIRRSLREAKHRFAEAGDNLDEDEEFVEIEEQFTALLAIYRALLRDNKLIASEDDIRLVQLINGLLKSVGTVPDFKNAYRALNDFVAEKNSSVENPQDA